MVNGGTAMATSTASPVSMTATPTNTNTHAGLSTPRRESRSTFAKLARRSAAGPSTGVHGAVATGNASTHATPASAAGNLKWKILRREVLPNPQFMKLTEKVQHVIETLKRPPEERTENDVKLLYTWLMHQEKLSSLFTTMSEVSAKKLCKEMEFRLLRGGEVVVNQGDKGNTCFILISGIVSVYVRNADDQQKYQRMMRSTMSSSSFRRISEASRINFGAKVATLTPGATFGELCLIEPDSKRSATVVVDPQVHTANFIVLTAASYLRMTRSQTIEGTITDHIAFLQHMLLFKSWTKMQVMHLVNSMKLHSIAAGQYLAHKGEDADSFFIILRGEAQECARLTINETAETSMGETRGVQHSIVADLTFLGKFDVAGEYIASQRKITLCPVDIRATSDVDCLVLTRKLFGVHFSGRDAKKHAIKTLKRLRHIADAREAWRETRVRQVLEYPNLRVPITRKLMRLSGNACMICGRETHVAGDQLCMELDTYHMLDEKAKKRANEDRSRRESLHRLTLTPAAPAPHSATLEQPASSDASSKSRSSSATPTPNSGLPKLADSDITLAAPPTTRLGVHLVAKQWDDAEKAGLLSPRRPQTTPAGGRQGIASIARSAHVANANKPHGANQRPPIDEELRRIRESWPYDWTSQDDHDGGAKRGASRSPQRRPLSNRGSRSAR